MRDDASYEYGFGYHLALLSIRRQFARVIRDRVAKTMAETWWRVRLARLPSIMEVPGRVDVQTTGKRIRTILWSLRETNFSSMERRTLWLKAPMLSS